MPEHICRHAGIVCAAFGIDVGGAVTVCCCVCNAVNIVVAVVDVV